MSFLDIVDGGRGWCWLNYIGREGVIKVIWQSNNSKVIQLSLSTVRGVGREGRSETDRCKRLMMSLDGMDRKEIKGWVGFSRLIR
jgi:hypothetical protein